METAGFAALGNYGIPVLIVLVEAVAAMWLLGGFLWLRRSRSRRMADRKEQRLFLDMLSQGSDSAVVMFRRRDVCPVFATENLEWTLGFDLQALWVDTQILEKLMDRQSSRRLQETYQSWDGENPLHIELQRSDNGCWMELELTRSPDGEYEMATFRDISQKKQELAQLQEKLDKAESASESKTTFLSRMSHEIRTPMNGVVGMLTLAQNSLKSGKDTEGYLNKAQSLSQHLLSIINDILDMSRIEAGKLELEEKPFDLFALGDGLRDMFQKNIEEKGLRFSLEFQDFTVRYVVGDRLRLNQVIINFLSNAMKFTSEGEISVMFRQMLVQNGTLDLMVRVHDTGIGMEPKFIERIFRPFEQEKADTARKYGGSGLGMAITDLIVRTMGGEIFVESLPGRGSDFTIFLHLPVAEGPAAEVPEEPERLPISAAETAEAPEFTLRGRRILMAEDNEINAEIALGVLEEIEGATVEVAENGQVAVERFESNPPGYYDFILMDIQMPVLDGRAACRKIRALERPDAAQIPVFALSADAFVEDERSSIKSGMNGHFSKPIDFDDMRRKIGDFFREQGLK